MMSDHDTIPVDPRVDGLLRALVTTDDLPQERDRRVRSRLGLSGPDANASRATHAMGGGGIVSIPGAPEAGEEFSMIAVSLPTRRRQWIELVAAGIAILLVGMVLVAVFRGSTNEPDARPGAIASPSSASLDDALSVEEAQEQLSFQLIVPELLPESLSIAGVFVDGGGSATIWLARESSALPAITVFQTTAELVIPPPENVQRSFLEKSGEPPTSPLPEPTQSTVIIAGQTMLQTIVYDADGSPVFHYSWEQGTVNVVVTSFDGSQDEVETVVAAIVTATAMTPPIGTATLSATRERDNPTPTSTEDLSTVVQIERLERERESLTPHPIPDTCEISEWTGPDFRIRQTNAAAYFTDGDGLSIGTTHGVLFDGENVISWLADGPLTTEQALSGPEAFSVTRIDETTEYGEITIQELRQIDQRVIPDEAHERAWTSVVSFPDAGCWRIRAEIGNHAIDAIVYVYSRPISEVSPIDSFLPGTEWDGQGEQGISQAEAEAFTDFPLYWLGESYAGYNLQMIVRNVYTPANEALAHEAMNSVTFIYGECTIPDGGSACSPPLTVSIEPVCLKPLSSFPQWADAMETVRGDALLLRSGEEQFRLWTGDISIRVSPGGDPARVEQIIHDLRGLNHAGAGGEPLLAPGLSSCQER